MARVGARLGIASRDRPRGLDVAVLKLVGKATPLTPAVKRRFGSETVQPKFMRCRGVSASTDFVGHDPESSQHNKSKNGCKRAKRIRSL